MVNAWYRHDMLCPKLFYQAHYYKDISLSKYKYSKIAKITSRWRLWKVWKSRSLAARQRAYNDQNNGTRCQLQHEKGQKTSKKGRWTKGAETKDSQNRGVGAQSHHSSHSSSASLRYHRMGNTGGTDRNQLKKDGTMTGSPCWNSQSGNIILDMAGNETKTIQWWGMYNGKTKQIK